MSQLSKSLEKRIQELTASIDAQKTELAAYQRVLHMELGKSGAPAELAFEAYEAPEEAFTPTLTIVEVMEEESAPPAAASTPSSVQYKGNKTNMVAEIVGSYGMEGATPKDVDAIFTAQDVPKSKNLIYNTLSYLVAHKRLVRREGKYYLASGPFPAKRRGPKPGKKKAAKTAAKSKRRLSPEGLERIREALKKRWADKKAAEEAAAGKRAATKTTAKKK
jgi:hypothetical protein